MNSVLATKFTGAPSNAEYPTLVPLTIVDDSAESVIVVPFAPLDMLTVCISVILALDTDAVVSAIIKLLS